jgi:hypothetical protein
MKFAFELLGALFRDLFRLLLPSRRELTPEEIIHNVMADKMRHHLSERLMRDAFHAARTLNHDCGFEKTDEQLLGMLSVAATCSVDVGQERLMGGPAAVEAFIIQETSKIREEIEHENA